MNPAAQILERNAAQALAHFIAKEQHRAERLTAALPRPMAQASRAAWAQLVGVRDAGNTSPVSVANAGLRDTLLELKAANVTRAYDLRKIRDHARNYATVAGHISTHAKRLEFIDAYAPGATFPKHATPASIAARTADARWWRRQLRKVWTRASENAGRRLGLVNRDAALYASDEAVLWRAAQLRTMAEYAEHTDLVSDAGETLQLDAVRAGSVSNPKIRRGEFMARARGCTELAELHQHAAVFVTLTCPSRFHAHGQGGRNANHTRESVLEGQRYLCTLWARARAKFKRDQVFYYGFRIAEPHHDGTPHWHLLLFVPKHQEATLRSVLESQALRDSPHEPGAQERRIVFKSLDAAAGGAVAYVAKYVSKNIDGAGTIAAADGEAPAQNVARGVARVDAWAAVHGIRQFQQLGGPAVTLWRELRRAREAVADADIERARVQADAGSYAGFVQCVGGIRVGRRTSIRLEKVETGERNVYGEHRPPRLVGLRCASALVITRPHTWRLVRRCRQAAPQIRALSGSFHDLGPVAITVRSGFPPSSDLTPANRSTAPP